MRKQVVIVCVCVVLGCVAGSGGGAKNVKDVKEEDKVLTFAEMKKKGMTTFLDREVTIKARVFWRHADLKIPEDPRPMKEIRKKAGSLRVSFEGKEFKEAKGKKYIRASVPKGLKVVKDKDGREGYAFNDLRLSNGGVEYLLKGKVKLRSMFKKEHLKNPAFIKQSNNPRYWTQTFELEISDIRKPEEKKPEDKKPGKAKGRSPAA
jgi:hypothetical protein